MQLIQYIGCILGCLSIVLNLTMLIDRIVKEARCGKRNTLYDDGIDSNLVTYVDELPETVCLERKYVDELQGCFDRKFMDEV